MEIILKNPLTLWLRWILTWFYHKLTNIGKHNRIEYGAELSSVKLGQYSAIYKYARVRNCSLGDFSYIARDSQVHHATIGKFCCIGPQVLIGLGEHPSKDFVSSHPMFYSEIGQANPVIVLKSIFNKVVFPTCRAPSNTMAFPLWSLLFTNFSSSLSIITVNNKEQKYNFYGLQS